MTINEDYDITKSSEIWLEAYSIGDHPDLRSFENFSGNFLKEVNNPSIKAENLISSLCNYTFSGLAVSSLTKVKHKGDEGDDEDIVPFLTIIHHPFKDSPSPTFRKGDSLFGVIVDETNPKKEIQTIEFNDLRTTFSDWKKVKQTVTAEEHGKENPTAAKDSEGDGQTDEDKEKLDDKGISTPAFFDFFDENFVNGNPNDDPYQPLNNATQIPPTKLEENADDDQAGTDDRFFPEPKYYPRKVIPLTPAMIKIILDKRETNFDGIINGIREYTWYKMKSTRKKESRKAYLVAIYRSLQAFWTHGQPGKKNPSIIDNFIRSDNKKLATIIEDDWATEKALNITESLAISLGITKKKSKDDTSTIDGLHQTEHTAQILDKSIKLCTAVQDITAKIMNQGAAKEQTTATFEESWAYKAVLLASSMEKTEPATKILDSLEEVRKYPEKNARDTIAQILNLKLKANFRIDKAMAANIRSFQIFQFDTELLANMTIFHCYPRSAFELRDIMSGEELDTRIKAKAISSNSTVKSFFEQKLGIADTAVGFIDQMFNFWKFNCFMFGDEAWVTTQIQKLYETTRDMRNEIKSLQKMDKEYIARIASKINND
jgi:hypothetical protein